MTGFGHTAINGNGFFADSWGRGPFEIEANGKTYRFEDSDMFGPALLRKDGELRANPYPNERSPFWRAHSLWRKQGRRVADDGVTCIWNEPRPMLVRHIGNRNEVIDCGEEDVDGAIQYQTEKPFGDIGSNS